MTQNVYTGFRKPRESAELNEHLRETMLGGPVHGFNVAAIVGTARVRIENTDGVGTGNRLITPEGVVIEETDAVVADVTVGLTTVGERYIVARYEHGTSGAACTYACIGTGDFDAAHDTILAKITKAAIGYVNDSMIREYPRKRFGGTHYPISLIYGAECTRGAVPLCMGGGANLGSWAAGQHTDMPTGALTALDGDVLVPHDHQADVKSYLRPDVTADLWVHALFRLVAISSGRETIVDFDFWTVADGTVYDPATPTSTYRVTTDWTGGSANDVKVLKAPIAGHPMGLSHLRVSRRGDLPVDNMVGTIQWLGGVLYYARSRVGQPYSSLVP